MQTEHSPFPSDETLAAYIDGNLDEETRKWIVEHMTECADCRDIVMGAGEIARDAEAPGRVIAWPNKLLYAGAAAAALAAVVLLTPIREKFFPKPVSGIAALAEAAPPYRPIAGRIAHMPYRPLKPAKRGEADQDAGSLRLLAAGAKIEEDLRADRSVRNLHDYAVAELSVGHTETAWMTIAEALKSSAGDSDIYRAVTKTSDADLLNDFGAVLLARAMRHDDTLLANEAIERAWKLRQSPETAWNRALALERLALRDQALQAWRDYVRLSPAVGVDEANRHIAELSQSSDLERWRRYGSLLCRVVAPANTDELARDYAANVRETVEDGTLRLLAGRPGPDACMPRLDTLRGFAESLARRGDALYADILTQSVPSRSREAARVSRVAQGIQAGIDAYEGGDYQRAATLLAEGKADAAAIASPLRFIAAIRLASARYRMSDYQGALAAVREPAAGYAGATARMNWLSGMALLSLGRPHDALRAYESAAETFDRLNDRVNAGFVKNLIAENLEYLGAYDDASPWRLRSLDMLYAAGDVRRLHVALQSFLEALLRRRRYPLTAYAVATALLHAAERSRSNEYLQDALNWNARAANAAGETRAASELIARAKTSALLAKDDSLRKRQLAAVAATECEVVLASDPRRSIGAATAALQYFNGGGNHFRIAELRLTRARARRAIQELNGAIDDLDAGTAELESQRSLISAPALRTYYDDLNHSLFIEEVGIDIDRGACEQAFISNERGHARSLRDALDGVVWPAKMSILWFSQRVPPHTSIVEYAVLPDRLVIFTLVDGRLSCRTSDIDGPAVSTMVGNVRKSLSADAADGRQALSRAYDLLVRPIRYVLDRSSDVVIVPDVTLSALSFPALYDSDRGRFFIEDFPITVSPGLFRFVCSRRGAQDVWRSRPLVLRADAVLGMNELPAVAREVDRLRAVLPGAEVVGTAESLDRTIAALETHSLIHFAGHSLPDESAEQESRLLFMTSGGPRSLSVTAISRLRLEGAALVVMSSCGSILGRRSDTEGQLGVAYAFLRSGARSVIGTVAPVDDSIGAELFPQFYFQLHHGNSLSRAFQLAQNSLLHSNDLRLRSPAAWGVYEFIR